MAGGGLPRTKINWPALTLAFNVLVLILGALMAYAYINGGTASRIDRLEADVRALGDRVGAVERRR